MGAWSRDELEEAFERFQDAAEHGGRTGDWRPWSECFTEDAEYREHLYGEFTGRAAILEWITGTMSRPPGNDMVTFPMGWHIVDEERGWVVCEVWNRMRDPGDGSVHEAANFTLLKYGGDGMWRYEEDVYNPHHFATMLQRYEQRRAELEDAK